jgi:hypothetical protein
MPVVQTPETIFPMAMLPEHAAAYLSISRRALSDLVADGVVMASKHGARTLVDVASLQDYYASLPKAVPGSIPNAPQSIGAIARSRGRA